MSKKRPGIAYLSLLLGILSLVFYFIPLLPQALQLCAIFFGWSAYNLSEYNPDKYKNSWIGWAGFFMGMIGLGVWFLSSVLLNVNSLMTFTISRPG